eukprot:GHVH01006758.1.p1 GENE.GHVH01006758.1~~GHVH01006758.1.p1  ORF type:complete len:371 (+),score=46.13 GHVH01006758.1:72-1184(+)
MAVLTTTEVGIFDGEEKSQEHDKQEELEDATMPENQQNISPVSTVMTVILLRYVVEISLGVVAKNLYNGYSQNVAGNLFFEFVVFFPLCFLFNWCNNHGLRIFSRSFGGEWKFSLNALKILSLPSTFWCLQILFKQTLLKDTGGPGYAEMLTGISILIGAIVQYFVNGIKTGIFGLCAAVLCAVTSMIAGYIVGHFITGVFCALFNVCRSSLMKKANAQLKQPVALNLLYCEMFAIPILFTVMLFNEYFHFGGEMTTVAKLGRTDRIVGFWGQFEVSGMFKYYFGCIPALRPVSFCFILFSLASNILVLTIYDLCSPVTYLVASQMKGVIQTAADIFFIDYFIVILINDMAIKNRNKLTTVVIVAFTIKT